MYKFQCLACEPQEYVLVDGYNVGDRLLEEVMFQVRVAADKKFTVVIDPTSASYFEKLNKEMWLQKVQKFVEKRDWAECPNCGEDVDLCSWRDDWVAPEQE